MSITLRLSLPAGLVCLVAFSAVGVGADEDKQTMKLGPVTLVAPKDWTYKKPMGTIVTYEFAVPASKDDKADGRFTVSSTGGSVEDNIKRWYSQVSADEGDSKTRAKPEKKTVSGNTVHFVDLTGTFRDVRPGTTPQKDYRLLGAVVETEDGNLYLKLVGPERTIADHAKAFRKMVEEMKSK